MSSTTLPLRPLTPPPLRSTANSPDRSRPLRLLHERAPRPLIASNSPLSSEKLSPTHKRKTPGDETFRGRSRTRSVTSDTSSAKRSRDRHRRSHSPSRGTLRPQSEDENYDRDDGTPRKRRRTHQERAHQTEIEALGTDAANRSRSRDRSRLRMKYRRASEKASMEVAGLRRGALRDASTSGAGGEDVFDDSGRDLPGLAGEEAAEEIPCLHEQRVTWGEGMRNREEVAGLRGETWLRRGSLDDSC